MATATTRRSVLRTAGAAAATTVFAAPFVHGAHAAGKLSVGVLGPLGAGRQRRLRKLCQEWADKEKVDIKIDFVTSKGDKLMLTDAAEAQARIRARHDRRCRLVRAAQTNNLEPADDLMAELIKRHGEISAGVEYLGKQKGHWIAAPAVPTR